MNDQYAAVVPAAARLAFVLTGDADGAAAVARRTFVRVRATFQDLRNPYARETALRRSVLRQVRRVPTAAEGEDDLWLAFLALPFRMRAALALHLYEELSWDGVADVMGWSPAAARMWFERGAARIDAGEATVRDRLGPLLWARASALDVARVGHGGTLRRARLVRLGVVSLVLLSVAAGGVTGYRFAATIVEAEDRIPLPGERRADGDAAVVDYSPAGAPDWCPPGSRLRAVGQADVAERNRVALSFAVALVYGYQRSLAAYGLPSPGAPDPTMWARPDTAQLRVVQTGSAAGDVNLIRACGVEVAGATWKVVLRGPGLPEVFAVYLGRTVDGWKAWGTLLGLPRAGLDAL